MRNSEFLISAEGNNKPFTASHYLASIWEIFRRMEPLSKELSHVSARKIAANRQNALKSTGPKTSRGKANSRTNALKHGLFAMDLYIAHLTKWEDPDEYRKLLDRLTDSYQPVGVAEELEVQQIAVRWRKRARSWRYENAEIAVQLCERHTELSSWEMISRENQARLELLKKAELEIEANGKLSEELKGRIFGDTAFAELWNFVDEQLSDRLAQDKGVTPLMIKEARDSDPDSGSNFLFGIARGAALLLTREKERFAAGATKLANDLEAIPRAEALDRVLRADAAAERSLNHAVARLERLQRQRQGETLPPPVTVRLTR
jgi:hypothetical protein